MKRLLLCFVCGMMAAGAVAQQDRTHDMVSQDVTLQTNAYPNPVTSSVNIDLDMKKSAMVRLKITDLIGKEIYRTNLQLYEAGSHTLNIPMATASPGVYFFNIIDETGYTTVSGRFVKQ